MTDWDELGLGSRALELVALALDCECGDRAWGPPAGLGGSGGWRLAALARSATV